MANYTRNTVQGFVLLCFILVVCFARLGHTHGKGINNKQINRKIEASHIVQPPCYKDEHQVLGQPFCCKKDKLCWQNLGECFINCPCKINCQPSAATQNHMIPTSKHT
ncbi:hypothetical protein TRIUR3_02362 [Triticum urartu]|uniref:Uncharacterized protein n=1 Tax=Triticum urartu TaxID=4572 RepID=M7ZLH3_TRIUA|nr:hypothetical protein TRIUR3_02362 [Triticum urartu]